MDKQSKALDDAMFDLAILGMMELEGSELLEEEKRLDGAERCQPSNTLKHKMQKALRRYEIIQSVATIAKNIHPFASRVAAAFLIIFIGISSIFVISVDAREMFYKLFAHETQRYTEVSGNNKFDGVLYAPTYIPEGYKVTEVDTEGGGYTALAEKGNTGKYVAIVCGSSNSTARLDTENADSIEHITINNSDALLIIKGERVLVSWYSKDCIFSVQTNDRVEEAVKIAESIE